MPLVIGKGSQEGEDKFIAIIEGVYFAIFYPNIEKGSLHRVIKRLISFLDKPVNLQNITLDIGGHIGTSKWPVDANNAENLIRKAMMAVRAAKWANKTDQEYSRNIDNYSTKRLSLMGEIKHAIDNNELDVFFHPKIDIQADTVVSMEALLRWRHPTRGMIQPGDFVELTEGTRIIHPLMQFVLEASVRHCSQLVREGYEITVAVNVFARNLVQEDFHQLVMRVLRVHKFDPGKLIIEVLESSMIEDMENTLGTLKKLESIGVRISLDDFGTGYSSLAYLKRLPVHEIKNDRSFVKDMEANHEDRLIIESTLALRMSLVYG